MAPVHGELEAPRDDDVADSPASVESFGLVVGVVVTAVAVRPSNFALTTRRVARAVARIAGGER